MISYLYKSLRTQKVERIDGFRRGVWVNLENPNEEEITKIVKDFNLDHDLLTDALDDEEMPRLERSGDIVYVYVRAPYIKKRGNFDTIPLLFVFAKDCFITISLKKLDSLGNFTSSKIDFATTQRNRLFLQIMQSVVDQYDGHISQTSKQIKTIRSRLRGHEINNKDFLDFVTIEDELNEFLSALQPNNATLRRLSIGRHVDLFDDDQNIIDDLLLSTEQSTEASRANIKSIVNIRQAYTAISSNNLNRTIKILTIATVMISLPNTIFGMYGMNVGLPFEHQVWAYPIIISVVLLMLLTVYLLLRHKRVI